MTPKNQKKYEDYMNEQFKILKDHFERIMLRVHNKFYEMEKEDD